MSRLMFDRNYLRAMLEKESAVKEAVGSVIDFAKKHPAMIPVGLAAASAGLGMLKDRYSQQNLDAEQRKAMSAALDMYPDIQNQDPQKVRMLWGTVLQFAPHVATNPHVLGTFLNATLKYPTLHIGPQEIKGLQDLEEGMTRKATKPGVVDSLMSNPAVLMAAGQALGGMGGDDLGKTLSRIQKGRGRK